MITQYTKDRLVDFNYATLDGKPAVIRGRLLQFPLVATERREVVFSWETVLRVVDQFGGKFVTALDQEDWLDQQALKELYR